MGARMAELTGRVKAAGLVTAVAVGLGMVGGYLVWLAAVMLVVTVFAVSTWVVAGTSASLLLAAVAFWLGRRSPTPAVRQALWWSPTLPVLARLYLTAVWLT